MAHKRKKGAPVTTIRSERSTSTTLLLYGTVIAGLLALGWVAVDHVPALSQKYDQMTGSSGAGKSSNRIGRFGKRVDGASNRDTD